MIEDINSHIINKINNNDLNFTKEELYFITINEELLSKLIEYICNHKDINLLDYFGFEALNTITSSNYLEARLMDEENLPFTFACIKAFTEVNREYSPDYRDFLNDEYYQKYLNFIVELFDRDIDVKLENINADDLIFFYNAGKIKQLEKIKEMKVFANDEEKVRYIIDQMEEVPESLAEEITVKNSQLPLGYMIDCFRNKDKQDDFYDLPDPKYKVTLEEIIEKIKSNKDYSVKSGYSNKGLNELLSLDQSDELIKLFIQNGLPTFVRNYVTEDDLSKYEEEIISCIRNPQVNLMGFSLYENKTLIKEMILNNRFEELYLNDNPTFEDYQSIVPDFKDRLISYIKNGGNIQNGMCNTGNEEIDFALIENIKKSNMYKYSEELLSKAFDYYLEKEDTELISSIIKNLYNTSFILTPENLNIIYSKLGKNKYFDYKIFDALLNKEEIVKNKDILNKYLESDDYFKEKIIEYISHQEESLGYYDENLYIKTKDYICKKYNLNKEHYEKMSTKFGYEIIRYIESNRIQTIINYDDETFNKLINLLNANEFDKNTTLSLFDAAMQYKFGKDNKDKINIRVNIIRSIESNDVEHIMYLHDIVKTLDDQFYKTHPQYLSHKEDIFNYLLTICEQAKTSTIEEREKTYQIIREISDYYIKYSREEYRKEHDMYSTLDIPFQYELKSLKKAYIKYEYAVRDSWPIKEMLNRNFGINSYEADEIIYFFTGRLDTLPDKYKKDYGKYSASIFDFCESRMGNISYDDMVFYVNMIEESHNIKIKRIYDYKRKDNAIYKMLNDINPVLLTNFILNSSHQKEYDKLKSILSKYSILTIPEYFSKLNDSGVDISFDPTNLRGFIEYFTKIYDEELSILRSAGEPEEKMDFGILSCLKKAESFSSSSDIFQVILGSEDARLIKSNPGPNAAQSESTSSRLEKSVENTVKNFKRQKLHIPTFNEVITLDDNKQMRVVVGNFTHPSNLTHGERTGACMRIGGAGNSLYEFCLDDPHGFHIRFEDPTTGKYISRVSGFRNGNTVFLNELRNSCDPNKYQDIDVIDACQKISKMIIDLSKDSTYPIENVVVHRAYAMGEYKGESQNLGVSNIKQGLKTFYSDVSGIAIVLASTEEPFKKVELSTKDIPEYLPAREINHEGKATLEIVSMINRVKAVKQMLEGKDYKYIALDALEPEKISYANVNQDYYVYIDLDGKIYSDYIDIDPRCKKEYEEALEKAKSILANKSKFKEKQEEKQEELVIDRNPFREYIIEEEQSMKL